MEFSLTELRPWTDIFNMLSQARTVTVRVDGKKAADLAEIERDDENNVTLSLTTKKPRKKKK